MRSTLRLMNTHKALYVMMLPVIAYFAVFVYYPLYEGVIASFQEFNLLGDRPWVGLDNYRAAFETDRFWQVLRNTLLIGGGILVLGFFPPIIVALALNELRLVLYKKFAQTVVYLPHLFSWIVIGGMWIYLLSPRGGLVNELLALVEIGPIRFLTNGTWARALMIVLPIWKDMGYAAIIYLASITAISPSLYEAARIDGASRFQQAHQFTLPMLVPTMKVVFMLNILGTLRIFDQIYIFKQQNPAVQSKIDVLMTYVYDGGIQKCEVGFASAVSVLVLLATLAMTAVVWKITGFGREPQAMGVKDPTVLTGSQIARATSPGGDSERPFRLMNIMFVGLLSMVMIVPFVNVLAVAFSSPLPSMEPGIKLWPDGWSVQGFRTVWTNIGLERAFINSVIVTTIGTFLHVLLAAFAGYVLIQRDLPGKRMMIFFILATMAIPGELIMIPLFIVNRNLGLLNTLAALVFSGLVSGFSIILLRNYFASVPYDLWESAKIDGAGDFHVFYSIYLPLSKAGIATVALFELVSRWNQFLPVILYISDSSKYTLQVALQALVTENMGTSGTAMVTPNVRMAGIVIAIVPLVILYPLMQRYFVQGITLGSVKE